MPIRTQRKQTHRPHAVLIFVVIGLSAMSIPNGLVAEDTPASPVSEDPSDPERGKSHWAFRPLQADVPDVGDSSWPAGDIDRFILAQLRSHQLAPADDAEPPDLLRRLTFQLTGLPPTPEQAARYRQNPSAETYVQLVDELLASPQFGQRWGRHWLDLARYADSNGLDENFLFREAWRYRNWVIDAVNADLPFDRFLLEQLAGDLLPWQTIEQRDRQRIAAGFLVVGPKVLLGVNPQKQKMDVADEQLDTIGRAVLGQTLGCARCHDHKFDPVPTADYYALAGIFTSTRVMEQRFMLNEQRVMEQLVGLGDEGDRLDQAYETYWKEMPALRARAEKAKAVLELLKQGDVTRIRDQLITDPEGFAETAKDESQPPEQRLASQESLVKELTDRLSSPPPIPPRAMIPADLETPGDEAVRAAGRFDEPGEKVPRGFLKVLCEGPAPVIPPGQSGRVELSRWLTDSTAPSGWLTARVQANRIWYHLTGCGLVRTVDNFGRTGELPSHPQLLDYLAERLIRGGWSFKSLIRQIVLSRTFRLSSRVVSENEAVDPDNRLFWRANRRRLDPESLRDAMLAAAGTLDLKPAESTVSYLGDQATAVGANLVRRRTDFSFRSVYLPVVRNDLPELFDVFDFANPHAATGMRPVTTVPTQALFLMNDPMVMETAELVARRVPAATLEQSLDASADLVFEWILNRPGSDIEPHERDAVVEFLRETESRLQAAGVPDPRLKAMAQVCHALFASSRFQFLE